ncbi:MAG: N-acetyltransferase [Leucobacter sp.]|nr:N-acetyltransferase [Leucobacter sp.]
MARYLTEQDAAAAGMTITHEPEAQRFAIYQAGEGDRTLVGEAHYSFPREGVVDFDHTVVDDSLRGTGLSGLLARRAVTSEVARANTVQASCWFIEGYLAKHPELLGNAE